MTAGLNAKSAKISKPSGSVGGQQYMMLAPALLMLSFWAESFCIGYNKISVCPNVLYVGWQVRLQCVPYEKYILLIRPYKTQKTAALFM